MTITKFSIEYDAINNRNTFTNGDAINGRIVVEVSKETTIRSLIFIGRGEAQVCWSEGGGQNDHRVFWQNEKYYEFQHYILRESRRDGTEVISKGRHVFPFSFQIPDRKMPSTFTSSIGKVIHQLKAELKPSAKRTKTAKIHFTFVSKPNVDVPGLMEPQYGRRDKSLAFNSGSVTMDVFTDRMGYQQGEAIRVKLEITNHSSRPVKPKFTLYEKQSFFAQGSRRALYRDIQKEKAEAVESSQKESVTWLIQLPVELPSSISNCSIIRLEYRLKVSLDIICAKNPDINLPIVVLPDVRRPAGSDPPASAGTGLEAFGGGPVRSPQQPAPPYHEDELPSYEACVMYPPFMGSKRHQGAL